MRDSRASSTDASAAVADFSEAVTDFSAALAERRPSRWALMLIHSAIAASANAAQAGTSPHSHDAVHDRASRQFMGGPYSRGSGRRKLDCETPSLTVTDPCIWDSNGTNLSWRQSATVGVRQPIHPRMRRCTLAGLATLLACAVDQKEAAIICSGGSLADLGKQPVQCLAWLHGLHRHSPLFPARSVAPVVRLWCGRGAHATAMTFLPYVSPW